MVNIEKYNRYMNVFHSFYDCSIHEKKYDITLVRSLMIYFLYKEKSSAKNMKVTFPEIATVFGMERSSTIKANQRILAYIENEQYLKTNSQAYQRTFRIFFYLFNKIFTQNN